MIEYEKISLHAMKYGFTLVQVIAIFTVGYFVSRKTEKSFKYSLSKFGHVDETLVVFLAGIVRYSLMIVTIVICLGKIGIQTTSIITVLGAAGLAIGMALQGTLSNIASGLMILVLRPFQIGEKIETGEIKGSVESIGLFATQLRDTNGMFAMVPNSRMWSKTIKNFSRNRLRRVVIDLSIPKIEPLSQVKGAILAEVMGEKMVLKDPPPQVVTVKANENSEYLKLKFWVENDNYQSMQFKMVSCLMENFSKCNISMDDHG